jgi:hypothetical protein
MPKPSSDVPNSQTTPPPELEKRTQHGGEDADSGRSRRLRARQARRVAATREALQQSISAVAPRARTITAAKARKLRRRLSPVSKTG